MSVRAAHLLSWFRPMDEEHADQRDRQPRRESGEAAQLIWNERRAIRNPRLDLGASEVPLCWTLLLLFCGSWRNRAEPDSVSAADLEHQWGEPGTRHRNGLEVAARYSEGGRCLASHVTCSEIALIEVVIVHREQRGEECRGLVPVAQRRDVRLHVAAEL